MLILHYSCRPPQHLLTEEMVDQRHLPLSLT
jgi:hypothetical protein